MPVVRFHPTQRVTLTRPADLPPAFLNATGTVRRCCNVAGHDGGPWAWVRLDDWPAGCDEDRVMTHFGEGDERRDWVLVYASECDEVPAPVGDVVSPPIDTGPVMCRVTGELRVVDVAGVDGAGVCPRCGKGVVA